MLTIAINELVDKYVIVNVFYIKRRFFLYKYAKYVDIDDATNK